MGKRTTLWAVALGGACAGVAGAQPAYEIVDLTELVEPLGHSQAQAVSINNDGTIVGFGPGPDIAFEVAFVWDGAENAALLDFLEGDNSAVAVRVEEDGTIVGLSELVELVQKPDFIMIFEHQKPTAWTDGVPTNLADQVSGGDTFIDPRFAWDRTDDGSFIGWGRSFGDPPYDLYGFLLEPDGTITSLGDLKRPTAANESGQIVGYNGDGQDKAYLWDNGELTNLHDDEDITGVTSRAWAVTEDGIVLGEAQFDIANPEEPAMWVDGEATPLVPEITRPQGVATGSNDAGVIVGYYNDLDDLDTSFFGFRIDDGERTNLFDLLEDTDGWTALLPRDINDQGQIVGFGIHDGQPGRAFLMNPVCTADFNGDGELNVLDFLAYQDAFGAGEDAADINGDGELNVLDFLAYQDLFQAGCA